MTARSAEWRRRLGAAGGGVPQTFDADVAASSDDAFQAITDAVTLTNTIITIDRDIEHCGLRWDNVTVPAGATIDVVHVGVFVSGATLDEPQHQIRGEASANPGTFTTTSNDIDARARTTATVNWDSADLGSGTRELWEWGATVAGEGNGANLKDIVQEIIDLGGWASGNAMAMIFEQHTDDTARDLAVVAWDRGDNSQSSKLHIEFTA